MGPMPQFTIQPHSPGDKHIYVDGPDELRLEVDFDDVFPEAVLHGLHAMVDILNTTTQPKRTLPNACALVPLLWVLTEIL